jgi:hypothetical protein
MVRKVMDLTEGVVYLCRLRYYFAFVWPITWANQVGQDGILLMGTPKKAKPVSFKI